MTISQSVPAGGPVGTPGAEMDAGEPVALPGRAGILRRLL